MFRARAEHVLQKLHQQGTAHEMNELTINLSEIFPLRTVIYEAVSPKIGLLGVKLANSTVISYGRALVWKSYGRRTMNGRDWAVDMHRATQLEGLFLNQSNVLAKFAGLET